PELRGRDERARAASVLLPGGTVATVEPRPSPGGHSDRGRPWSRVRRDGGSGAGAHAGVPSSGRLGGPMTLSVRDRNFTLVGVLLALFLGAIDQTIVATALPSIVDDLGGLSRCAWVITASLVASTVLGPIYGKLADTYSRKRIELWAVSVFLAGSFLCGLAGEFGPLPLLGDGMNQLIAFRALQGLGGAGLFSLAFIIIADLFPPKVRGKYQGLVRGVFGIASVLVPLLGG